MKELGICGHVLPQPCSLPLSQNVHREHVCLSVRKEVHRAYLPVMQSYQNVIIFAVHDEIDTDNAKALQDN